METQHDAANSTLKLALSKPPLFSKEAVQNHASSYPTFELQIRHTAGMSYTHSLDGENKHACTAYPWARELAPGSVFLPAECDPGPAPPRVGVFIPDDTGASSSRLSLLSDRTTAQQHAAG